MTNLIKYPLVTAVAVLTITGNASAQERFKAKIKPTPGASIEVNYNNMEQQALRYCRRQSQRADGRGLSVEARRFVPKCVAELMDKVVSQIQDPVLTAYHENRTDEARAIVENQTGDTKSR